MIDTSGYKNTYRNSVATKILDIQTNLYFGEIFKFGYWFQDHKTMLIQNDIFNL